MPENNLLDVAANDNDSIALDAVSQKLIDAQTPGFHAEFDPEEAGRAGAFEEDALSEGDARESVIDPAQ